MISTAELVRRISQSRAPILLPDTCALLDLIREPTREGFTGAHVDAARRLIARTTARRRALWIAITDQVLSELQANCAEVEQGAEVAIKRLEDTVQRVQSIMSAHGLKTTAPGLVAAGFPSATKALVQQYLNAALHVRRPRGVQGKAWARLAANIAPAQKGQQAKDCIILESYLQIARELRASAVLDPIVFFTTNTRDYSSDRTSILHPTLVRDFDALKIRYAVNFGMAEHLLT